MNTLHFSPMWALRLLACSLVWLGGSALAATYFVATTGSDEHSCEAARQVTSPKRTLTGGVGCLSEPGDSLSIRGGMYAERLQLDGQTVQAPSGLSWDTPITIRAFEDEKVVLRPGAGGPVVSLSHPDLHYLILQGLVIDATKASHGLLISGGAHHVRVQQTEIFLATSHGIETSYDETVHLRDSAHEFLDVHIHDNGSSEIGGAGIQLGTSGNLVARSRVVGNSGAGLSIVSSRPDHGPDANRLVHNHFMDNGEGASGWGLRVASGDETVIFNNVLWNNSNGILIGDMPISDTLLFHNTVIGAQGVGVKVHAAGSRTLLQNNIIYGHQDNVDLTGSPTTVADHNLLTFPKFVDADGGDFRLRSDSPAVDVGLDISQRLAAHYPEAVVDLEGISRPQGSGWDVGAYEWAGSSADPPTAGFAATVTKGASPLSTDFLDFSTGVISHWLWDFGDGHTSTEAQPSHVYASSGTYTVSLSVSGPGGSHATTQPQLITVTPSPPEADFSVSTRAGVAPLTVTFSDSSLGDVTNWDWEFGNGDTSSDRHPTMTYTSPGTYAIQLQASGPLGSDVELKPTFISVSPPLGGLLFHDSFNGVLQSHWTVVDEGEWQGPSRWSAGTGTLIQTSNIWSPPADGAMLAKLGTYLWHPEGIGWKDYRVDVTLHSSDDDALGVMFRYQNPNNYYRLSWDRERGYRRVIKRVDGVFTLLAEEAVPYVQGQPYAVRILVYGNTIDVQVNGEPVLGGIVTDPSLATGSVGFYSWFNKGSAFEEVTVTELLTEP